MADRWDYYEVSFSLAEHLNEDDALVIFNELDDDDRILGAALSCGSDSAGHPFNKTQVTRAADALGQKLHWMKDDSRARELVETVLAALYERTLPLPRNQASKEA